jgi:MYXO-CTERM domain-containing protein
MPSSITIVRRRTLAVGCVLAVLLLPLLASAAGRIQWSSKTYKERDGGSWRLDITLFLPKAPDTPHVPIKFEFLPLAYYERAMVDGDKLIERKVPLQGKQALIETVDVGFLDPASGKTESRTKLTFKVTRAHGYEAGEYRVTLRDGRNRTVIGTPTTLIFAGENEIIDRRAMVFATQGAKKKKEDMKAVDKDGNVKEAGGEGSGGSAGSEAEAEEGSESGSEPADDDGESPGEVASDPADNDKPGEIKDKPGGCGCRVAEGGSSREGLSAMALLALALLRRRRA